MCGGGEEGGTEGVNTQEKTKCGWLEQKTLMRSWRYMHVGVKDFAFPALIELLFLLSALVFSHILLTFHVRVACIGLDVCCSQLVGG